MDGLVHNYRYLFYLWFTTFLDFGFPILSLLSKKKGFYKKRTMAAASRRSLGQLLQQGWHEIPEVLATTGMAVVGIALGVAGCYNYTKNDGDNKRYKQTFIVMRPDDPRVKLIRKD